MESNTKQDDISSIESESGIIASLIHKPEFIFYSENLLPNHFVDNGNRAVYTAIKILVERGVKTIDPYNIMESLNSNDVTRKELKYVSIEGLNDLMENSDLIARNSIEEYKLLVDNVLDSAFRREMISVVRSCEALCMDKSKSNVRQQIYSKMDELMTEYSTAKEIPPYKDVIDSYWEEIQQRQSDGYAGIKFKFPALNDYATIEPGELFIFAAEAKQGKSMMLLNCAVDLLKQNKAVLYLDSELNSRLFTARILAHLAKVEYRNLVSGYYDQEELDRINAAREWMKTRKFTHIYIPMFDPETVFTAVKTVQHTQGIDVLIVD